MKHLPLTFLVSSICLLLAGCSGKIAQYETTPLPFIEGAHALPQLLFCETPDPTVPSSAFDIFQSDSEGPGGYWVRYQCKQPCEDWRQCLVPAYSDDNGSLIPNGRDPGSAKKALAFVVDGMAGHLALSGDGKKTVFIHTGAGGTRYYSEPANTLEQMSSAKTVMIRWEKGYVSPIVQTPFIAPISWGWYSRTSAEPGNIKELNKRVASAMAWSHDNISKETPFGTLSCSMGSNATFGPVLWHGLDPLIDYQVFVGGPNMWDLNAQCARRSYLEGYCDVDGLTPCNSDSSCRVLDDSAHCVTPDRYTTIDLVFNQLPNHIHATQACDIRATDKTTTPYPPFDESSMAFAEGADWEVDHKIDFLVNLGAKQGKHYPELGGDEYWGLGHFPYVFNKIQPDNNKRWHSIPNTHHCDGINKEALELIKKGMDL